MGYYIEGLKRYCDFHGRSSRTEFWWFMIISAVISIILSFIDTLSGTVIVLHQWEPVAGDPTAIKPLELGTLQGIYSLAVLLPSIGIAVRRLHDIGRSGWWWLLNFICCIGWIVLIVFYCLPSSEGDNQYGPNPHGE